MNLDQFLKITEILKKEYPKWDAPAKRFENAYKRTPFTILISALLSTRTKDETTLKALQRLLKLADNPKDMLKLSCEEIEKEIYPVGFYKTKSKAIIDLCKTLTEKYNSQVPNEKKELLKLKGVGEKVANIVLESAFEKECIAVDTHVHRIVNLLGFINSKNEKETEKLLEKKLDKKHLKNLNKLLVSFGQVICTPKKPKCDICPILEFCKG